MALKIGDKVPHFKAQDAAGFEFDSHSYIGRKSLVIYFYPKDDTHICTQQACSFRDQYQEFKELGAEVIGISSDSIRSHQKFATKNQLPFILLSDNNKAIRSLFGVPGDWLGLIPGRATYVVDMTGIITMIFNSTAGAIHIEKALEALKQE